MNVDVKMTNSFQSKLDRDLIALRDDVLRTSDMTDKAILLSVRALKDMNIGLASDVINSDSTINQYRYNIEQQGYQILATQQPTARDMRSIISSIHVVVELERIADHAAGIAKLTLQLADGIYRHVPNQMITMTSIAREMLKASIDAYLDWDAALAQQTYRRDDEIDGLHVHVCDDLIKLIEKKTFAVREITYLLWVSHNLERIGDRITNVCERVIFMVTGELLHEQDG